MLETVMLNVLVSKCAPEEKKETFSLKNEFRLDLVQKNFLPWVSMILISKYSSQEYKTRTIHYP